MAVTSLPTRTWVETSPVAIHLLGNKSLAESCPSFKLATLPLCKTLFFSRVGCESWDWLCPLARLLCVLILSQTLPDPARPYCCCSICNTWVSAARHTPHPSPGGQARAALSTSHTTILLESAAVVPCPFASSFLPQM